MSAPFALSSQVFAFKTQLCCLAIALEGAAEAEFDESKVKRDASGKFSKKSESGSDSNGDDKGKNEFDDIISNALKALKDVSKAVTKAANKLKDDAIELAQVVVDSKTYKDLSSKVSKTIDKMDPNAKEGFKSVVDTFKGFYEQGKEAGNFLAKAAKDGFADAEKAFTKANKEGDLSYAIGASVGLAVCLSPFAALSAVGLMPTILYDTLFVVGLVGTSKKLFNRQAEKSKTFSKSDQENFIKQIQKDVDTSNKKLSKEATSIFSSENQLSDTDPEKNKRILERLKQIDNN